MRFGKLIATAGGAAALAGMVRQLLFADIGWSGLSE